MKKRTFTSLVILMVLVTLFIPEARAFAQDDLLKTGAYPVLKSPQGTILDTTPSYEWMNSVGVDQFQYQVYQGLAKLLDRTVSSSICGVSTCVRTPSFPLVSQPYKWRVRAHLSSGWSAWSPFMNFTVSPPGFNSSFNGSLAGWTLMGAGTWINGSSIYLQTNGQPDKYTVAYRTSGQYTDFDYSARIRKKGNDFNFIVFRLNTTTKIPGTDVYPGYYLGYTNLGDYSIFYLSSTGGLTEIQNWAFSSAVDQNGWNTLRVVAKGSQFKCYINGTLVKSFTETSSSRGYVGVTSLRTSGSTSYTFYVDWAKLTVIETPQ